MPSLRALLDEPAPRGGRRRHPARRRGRPGPARRRPSPVAELAREAGIAGADARRGPATRTSWPSWPTSRPTAARSSPTARCCRRPPSPSRAHGWVNLHFSLLPAWRGAAPVQHAILPATRSPARRRSRSRPASTPARCSAWSPRRSGRPTPAGDLLDRLAVSGARLLRRHDGRHRGRHPASRVPQPADGVSIAPKLTVDDARVDWTQPALARRPAGSGPAPRRPGAWTDVPRRAAQARPGPSVRGGRRARAPGELRGRRAPGVAVGTGARRRSSSARSSRPGKRPMPAADWARGARLAAG